MLLDQKLMLIAQRGIPNYTIDPAPSLAQVVWTGSITGTNLKNKFVSAGWSADKVTINGTGSKSVTSVLVDGDTYTSGTTVSVDKTVVIITEE